MKQAAPFKNRRPGAAWARAAAAALRSAGVPESLIDAHTKILYSDRKIVHRKGRTLAMVDNPHLGGKAVAKLPETVREMFGKEVAT